MEPIKNVVELEKLLAESNVDFKVDTNSVSVDLIANKILQKKAISKPAIRFERWYESKSDQTGIVFGKLIDASEYLDNPDLSLQPEEHIIGVWLITKNALLEILKKIAPNVKIELV